MTDFFTPIQVPSSKLALDDQYQIQKYKNDPFMPADIKQQSLGDHRKKIMHWLKSMPTASRINRLTFTNKQFACLMISMFEKLEERGTDCLHQFAIAMVPNQGFKITEQRVNRKPNPRILEAQNKLIKFILIANRYSRFDSVAINQELAADINLLFELFDVIENGISSQLTLCSYQNYKNSENSHLIFYNPLENDHSITKSLGSWIVQVIKKNLCIQYFRQNNSGSPDQLMDLQLQVDYFKIKSKIFRKYWNSCSLEFKQKLIKNIFSRDIRSILSEYRQVIKLQSSCFPNIKYCDYEEIDDFVNRLVHEDGQTVLAQLFFTTLQQSSYEIAVYKYEILIQIELEIQKNKKQEIHQNHKKSNKFAKINHKQVKNSEKTKLHNHNPKEMKSFQTEQPNCEAQLQLHKQTKQQTIQDCKKSQLKAKKKTNLCKNSKKKKRKICIIQSSKSTDSLLGNKQESQTTNDQDDKQIELENQNCQKKQNYADFESIKSLIVTKNSTNKSVCQQQFNKILKQFDDKVSKWNKYQTVALNRMSSVLQAYNLSYQVFGSFANGLAIHSSDIDICIDPTIIHYFYTSFCGYREKIILALQFMQSCFQQMGWASNFNLITTASVPVLVFQIDLGLPYGDPNNMAFNIGKTRKSPLIRVDLTIQPFQNMQKQYVRHLGYESTNLVKQWLNEYSQLGQLVRIVKHMLNSNDLNKSFKGGLSSYALTSIIYSFLKSCPDCKDKQTLDLLILFCDFISNFNEQQSKIQVNSAQPVRKCLGDRLVVQNYLNGKNLAQNCYRFADIKALMGKIKYALTDLGQNFTEKQYSKNLRAVFLQ